MNLRPEGTTAGPFRILLVEDNQAEAVLFRKALEGCIDYTRVDFDHASTCELAVGAISTHPRNLVVCDINFNGHSDHEGIAGVMQAITDSGTGRMVLVSGDSKAVRGWNNVGMKACVKPRNVQELTTLVADLLEWCDVLVNACVG